MQTGTGHFSPIGGYHAGRDMALILDVARFKYPPHWVPLTLLWEAMDRVDDATGHRRGYVFVCFFYSLSYHIIPAGSDIGHAGSSFWMFLLLKKLL